MRALVVEDDPMIGRAVVAGLHEQGYAVDWVRDGHEVELALREFAVLEALMKEPGAVVSRERLEDAVYGWGEEIGSNSIEVHVHHLRRKLASDLIRNVRGVGYRIARLA